MVDYSAVFEELRSNVMNAGADLSNEHWSEIRQAFQAVTDGRTKENTYAKVTAAVIVTSAVSGIWSVYNMRKMQKLSDQRIQTWREVFDSSLRVIDILQDTSWTDEEKQKKVTEEMEFIKITRQAHNL